MHVDGVCQFRFPERRASPCGIKLLVSERLSAKNRYPAGSAAVQRLRHDTAFFRIRPFGYGIPRNFRNVGGRIGLVGRHAPNAGIKTGGPIPFCKKRSLRIPSESDFPDRRRRRNLFHENAFLAGSHIPSAQLKTQGIFKGSIDRNVRILEKFFEIGYVLVGELPVPARQKEPMGSSERHTFGHLPLQGEESS